jgi:hypothetical protein
VEVSVLMDSHSSSSIGDRTGSAGVVEPPRQPVRSGYNQ